MRFWADAIEPDVETAYICRGYIWDTHRLRRRPWRPLAITRTSTGRKPEAATIAADDTRDAVKGMRVPEARRDLTFGGVGIAVEF